VQARSQERAPVVRETAPRGRERPARRGDAAARRARGHDVGGLVCVVDLTRARPHTLGLGLAFEPVVVVLAIDLWPAAATGRLSSCAVGRISRLEHERPRSTRLLAATLLDAAEQLGRARCTSSFDR